MIAKHLKAYLASRGISAAKFAVEMDVTRACVWNWLQGRDMTLKQLRKIARHMGVEAWELLK